MEFWGYGMQKLYGTMIEIGDNYVIFSGNKTRCKAQLLICIIKGKFVQEKNRKHLLNN